MQQDVLSLAQPALVGLPHHPASMVSVQMPDCKNGKIKPSALDVVLCEALTTHGLYFLFDATHVEVALIDVVSAFCWVLNALPICVTLCATPWWCSALIGCICS